jgi:hypothetical protein
MILEFLKDPKEEAQALHKIKIVHKKAAFSAAFY